MSLRTLGHLTWRARHPAARGPFAEPPPRPLRTCWYTSEDGVHAPLHAVPPRAGGAGEPVLLLHAVGVGVDAFRYGAVPSLADALAERGLAPWLLAHRGDRAARAPSGIDVDFDAILERDLPAALDAVRRESGMPRVHLVGHGLGGQLALAWAPRDPDGIASVTAIATPVRFEPRAEARSAELAARLLPAGWPVPVRWGLRLAAPFLGPDELGGALTSGASAGARIRGAALHAGEDLPVGLLGQLASWARAGAWTSRGGVVDWLETLRGARCPLHIVHGLDDRVCPPASATPALARWGHVDRAALTVPGYGHLDALLGDDAAERVHAPVADWIAARRKLSWEPGFR